jgi:2-iminobutanoate/2-iminopropanoate deaminase
LQFSSGTHYNHGQEKDMSKEIIFTDAAPQAVGPYIQGAKSNGTVYCSGQLGIIPETGKLAEGIEAQTHQSLKNLGAVLQAAGSGFAKALKTTIFLTDMNDFAVVNSIYKDYFEGNFPARSCIQAAKLPLGGLVEVECIAEV